MFSEQEIIQIITDNITSYEQVGKNTGGSGHLGNTSFEINDYSTKILNENRIEITYDYTLYVETEFTYYPDNPPYEYHKQKTIVLNKNKEIVEESDNK